MLKWINMSTIHTCLDCLKEPKLTSNTKPDIIACLGAWYTWDRILQTSLEEIYTKDEINEMVTGICGAQEKLGDELKTLVDDTYQPLDIGYNELFRSMAHMRTEIESMQHILEKEAMTSPSIDANKATSIDIKPQTSQISAGPESLAEKKDEWEIAYINTKINDVYNPLNNNVDWLSRRIDLLQQDLDTIPKKDQQPATSIDICTITSIDSKAPASTDKHLVASIDTMSTLDAEQLIQNKMESMHEELNELSAYAYDKIGWHQFSIENTQQRLQNISNAIHKMDER
ncbi:hypothetical protein F2Q69_00004526 [Brassica cretica]|uniref:Uncharacterized protein n=1 Tax=Brassica cretica TaxID=69181 RepID=A0A8S9P8R4_BRACR|nr:hypothetical protein F2Q69_00004526 [Brassica cretica]